MQPVEGCRPVAMNVGVKNLDQAIEFYEAAFGVRFETDESEGRRVHARLVLGQDDSFFLFNMRERAPDEPHRDHITAFGFVVDDLKRHMPAPFRREPPSTSRRWTAKACRGALPARQRAGWVGGFVRALSGPAQTHELPPAGVEPPDPAVMMAAAAEYGIDILGPPGIRA